MFIRRPILPGTTDLDQLEKIWQLCGTPNQHSWPNFDQLPGCDGVKRFNSNYNRKVKSLYERFVESSFEELEGADLGYLKPWT
jgi:serine/threonine-protein kinase BUR1